MKEEIWTKKWKEVLIWLCGYVSLIAYALVGGYVIVKSEDEQLKKTAKTVLIVTLIFTALSAFLSLFNYCGNMSDHYYGSAAYDFYSVFGSIVGISRILVFAAFAVYALVKDKLAPASGKEASPAQAYEENADQQ